MKEERRKEEKERAKPGRGGTHSHSCDTSACLLSSPMNKFQTERNPVSDKVCSAEDDAQSGPWPSCANTLPTHKHPTPESLVRGKAEHPVEDNTPIRKDGLHMVAPFQHSPQPGDQGKGTFLLCSLPPANPHQVPHTKTIGKPSRALAIRTAESRKHRRSGLVVSGYTTARQTWAAAVTGTVGFGLRQGLTVALFLSLNSQGCWLLPPKCWPQELWGTAVRPVPGGRAGEPWQCSEHTADSC